ncbi:hypothetical protein BCR35DRAFT_274858 [Leucosporidium creatinivorum]|uniref:SH3 domain-containing protein n=1 Tax=Leucosporidium creatinivorum TaxID=106004 RepID=A0A1Y2G5Q9_9BASI|nr:hypothetical protein BCR35DRAFT_274858 [Leucosporidium creatinivorum]
MGGNNNPLPVALPQECRKAAKLFSAFVDPKKGLDSVIPADIVQRAKGFAFLTVVKAGFVFSARAGSGVVIAKLQDGSWSAPSAVGTAGGGVGFQAGVEMAEFLIILNSRAAVASFMASGSLTLGGNMSIAAGPIGRNVEGTGSVSTKGKVSAMYSYSRTKGLFGGASIEGSVIVERQDANAKAYGYNVTAKQLLSGQVEVPGFADILVDTISRRSGGAENWTPGDDDDEIRPDPSAGYSFGSQFASGGSSPAGAEKKRFTMGRSRSSSTAVKSEGDLFGFGTGGPLAGGEARFEQQFSDEFRLRDDDDDDWRAGSGATAKSGKSGSAKLTKSWGGAAGGGGGRDREQWSAEASPSTTRDSFDSLDRDDDRDRSGYGRFGDNDEDDYAAPQKTGRFRSSTTTSSGSRPSLFARARSASSPFTSRNAKSSRPTTPGATTSPFDDAYSSPPSRSQPLSTAKPWDSEDEDFFDPPPSRPPPATFSPSHVLSTPKGDPFDLSEVDASFQDTLAEIAGEREPRRHAPPPPKTRSRSSTGGGGIGRAIALYDFNGVESTDLPFKKGDIITILAKDDEEWWKGRLKISEGMFPRNYVEAHFDE